MMSTFLLGQERRAWIRGQTNELRIREVFVRIPTRMSEDVGMCSVVLPKRRVVEIMVVKPKNDISACNEVGGSDGGRTIVQ